MSDKMNDKEFMDSLLDGLMDKILTTVSNDATTNDRARESAFQTMVSQDVGLVLIVVSVMMSGGNVNSVIDSPRLSDIPRYLKKIFTMASDHIATCLQTEDGFIEMMRTVYRIKSAPKNTSDICNCPACTERRANVKVTMNGIRYHDTKNG